MIPHYSEDTLRRLWAKVDIRGENECWPWKGVKTKKGYGRHYSDNRHVKAHRVVANVPHKSREVVLHTCDNPGCLNPLHLKVGTQRDNIRDCVSKDRRVRSTFARRKLSREEVAVIKGTPHVKGFGTLVSKHFQILPETFYLIRSGKMWTDVPPAAESVVLSLLRQISP